jgi:small subunit ribosomal protein S17
VSARTKIGVVVSNKMDKTAVVSVETRSPHPLYRKIVRRTKRYKAHDPNNAANLGDVVRIVETRPISKEKHWRIAETLTRGDVADIAPRDIGAPEEAPEDVAAPLVSATSAAPASEPAEEGPEDVAAPVASAASAAPASQTAEEAPEAVAAPVASAASAVPADEPAEEAPEAAAAPVASAASAAPADEAPEEEART